MSLDTMDWENQRAFLAVLQGGSLSAASRQLGVAQPTVRRRLEALERSLGTALFTRSPSGLAPTDAARELGPHVEAMAAAAAAFTRASSAGPAEIGGTVRITASEIVGAEVLPSMLADLRREHPGLKFEVHLSNYTQDLLRQEADIAIRMVRPQQAALVMKHVGSVALGLFAHPAYLAAHGVPKSGADLASFSVIGPDRTADEVRAIAAAFGIQPQKLLSFRMDSHIGQLAALRAGVGIGVCQLPLARRAPALVRLLENEFEHHLPAWVVMHEDLARVPRIRATFDHLVAQLTRYCSEGRTASKSALDGSVSAESA
ncbi:MAG: LysR family transcriptional regulator [Rhizobiaceae bacterium]|nr:LysR family transcriptional regulator [Rhizobiaceae bacterium]